PWPCTICPPRPSCMWWCMSSAIFWCRTTAPPSGPRWKSACPTGRPAAACCGRDKQHGGTRSLEPKHAPEPGHNKYTKLAGNTMIFAISSFSSKLLTLIVQPFLTYAMRDVQSMGVSKLLSQCANLLIPLVSMGMSNAIIRFGLDKGNSKKQVFTNGLLTILLGYALLLLCWPLLSLAPGIGDYGVFLC